jgi:hypothetical protein
MTSSPPLASLLDVLSTACPTLQWTLQNNVLTGTLLHHPSYDPPPDTPLVHLACSSTPQTYSGILQFWTGEHLEQKSYSTLQYEDFLYAIYLSLKGIHGLIGLNLLAEPDLSLIQQTLLAHFPTITWTIQEDGVVLFGTRKTLHLHLWFVLNHWCLVGLRSKMISMTHPDPIQGVTLLLQKLSSRN